jgi:PmbA protein
MSARKQIEELYYQEGYTLPVIFKSGRLHSIQARRHQGWGLRLLANGREGFSSSTSGDLNTLRRLAKANLPYGPQSTYALPRGDEKYPRVQNYDNSCAQANGKELIELGKQILSRIKSFRIKDLVIDIDLRVGYGIQHISNSLGLDRTHRASFFEVSVEASKSKEGDLLSIWGVYISPKMEPEKALSTTEHILTRLKWSERIVKPKTARMPVIFSPWALPFGVILQPLSAGLAGENWIQGISPLQDKLGKQITHPSFSLYDNPVLPGAVSSTPFDGEGLPTSRRAFIDKGKLVSPVLTLETAKKLRLKPTATAQRTYKSRPGGGFSLMEIGEGTKPFKRILSEVSEGIYVDILSGGGQSNIIAGEFSLGVMLGFYIKNGKIVGRVKDCMLAGNVYDCLQGGFELSAERENPLGSVLGPYIRMDSLTVSGKGK